MFSGLFGKGNNSDKEPPKEAVDSRGLEVVEDDPDTAWGLWDSALAAQDSRPPGPVPPIGPAPVAMGDEANTDLPAIPTVEVEEVPTVPVALEERPLEQRKEIALAQVDLHHHRIANTIRSMWGYKECGVYLNKLIMDGGDGMGHSRIGFNQEAVEAMLALLDLHEKEFGPSSSTEVLGFGDSSVRPGIGGVR